MKKGKAKSHTGKIRHGDMGSLMDGHGSPDPLASKEYKAHNAEHGMPHGLSPQGEYDNGGEESEAAGTGGNCTYHE
jgi:hypothetical protein